MECRPIDTPLGWNSVHSSTQRNTACLVTRLYNRIHNNRMVLWRKSSFPHQQDLNTQRHYQPQTFISRIQTLTHLWQSKKLCITVPCLCTVGLSVYRRYPPFWYWRHINLPAQTLAIFNSSLLTAMAMKRFKQLGWFQCEAAVIG
jgi:hypothetical protein